ncbi:MAG: hypothetical protein FWF88_09695, partial [Peptococcaceae bacterium]|nr:hypothetical protein [Peptococcaceae bacterium]
SIMNHRQHGQISIALSTLIFIAAVGAACLMGASTATAGMDANPETIGKAQAETMSGISPETASEEQGSSEASEKDPNTSETLETLGTTLNALPSNTGDPCGDITKWQFPGDNSWYSNGDGKLVHDVVAPRSAYAQLKNTVVTDGTISVILTLERQSDSDDFWGGLSIRREAGKDLWQTGYIIYLRVNGRLSVFKGTPAGDKDIFAEEREDLTHVPVLGVRYEDVNNDGRPDRITGEIELKVKMRGDRFDVYVNDTWVCGFNDSTWSSGYVGPVAYNAKISCRDFRVIN